MESKKRGHKLQLSPRVGVSVFREKGRMRCVFGHQRDLVRDVKAAGMRIS